MIKDYLKLIAIRCIRIFIRVFYIFPIKNNRIFFHSYLGGQYACNPKYITEYLVGNHKGDFEIIWAFRDKDKYKYLEGSGIKIVSYFSLMRLYYEITSKVSINNVGSFSWLPLRDGQVHINTWHGGGCYKKVSIGEKANSSVLKKTMLYTVKETSYFLSSSKYFSDYVIPHDFSYDGEVLGYGMPRNDVLFGKGSKEIRDKVKQHFKINDDCIIILYAPTWKYDMECRFEKLDVEMLMKAVEKRYNKPCVVLYRAHHISGDKPEKNEIDATNYHDMQELLAASDMLISDYSSCIWDFSITRKPCFLYTPDLKEYIETRGFDREIHSWGFPVCESNIELKETIENFDEDQFADSMIKHHKDLGSFESGKACESLYKKLRKICFS